MATKTVSMIAPDGSTWDIPEDRAKEALANGGKMAMDMIGPDGQRYAIPFDKVHAAMKDGGRLAPPELKQPVNVQGQKFNPAEAIAYAVTNPSRGLEAMGKGMEQTSNELNDTTNDGAIGAGTKHVASVALGAIKAVPKGLIDADNLIRKGLNKVGGDYEMVETPKVLENKNGYETAGNVLENIAEFMWGEGELKALTQSEKLAKLSKVAKVLEDVPVLGRIIKSGIMREAAQSGIMREAALQGTVGGAQEFLHSQGDLGQSAKTGMTTGAMTAGLGVIGKLGGKALEAAGWGAKGTLEKGTILADDFAVDGVGSNARNLAHNLETGAVQAEKTGFSDLAAANRAQIPALQDEAANASIKSLQASKTQQGLLGHVKDSIAQSEEAMHSTYDGWMNEVSKAAKDVPVNISGSPLQKAAADLLGDRIVPKELQKSLKGVVPDSERLTPLLEELATSNKSYSWEAIEATRKEIGATIRKLPMDNPVRGDLIKLRYAIDDTMQKAVEQAGKGDIADLMKGYRNYYANQSRLLDERVIKSLAEKQPDTVANILLNSTSLHNVETLRKTIGVENMKAVESGLFRNLLQRSMNAEGKLDGNLLSKNYTKLNPATKEALWGSRMKEVDDFIKNASWKRLNTAKNIVGGLTILGGVYGLAKGEDAKDVGLALALGVGGGKIMRIPPEALANEKVLTGLGNVLKYSGGDWKVGNIEARKAMAAFVAAMMRDKKSGVTMEKGESE